MELWASGFNAWNQLQFDGELPVEPRDVDAFKCVLRDDKDIEVLRTSLSATLVRTSSGLRIAGDLDNFSTLCIEKSGSCVNVAVAGNDKVAEFRSSIITQYDSPQRHLEGKGESLGEFEDILQLIANQTSFTALSTSGQVITWGDGRYEMCLGRDVNGDSPASVPSVVEDLLDLPTGPIKKISSGGFMTAALTASNDLYIWGGRPGESKVLEKFAGSPSPLDLDGHDVLDIAVGDNHMVALTTDRVLFVAGDNGNGQLGLEVAETNDWKQALLPLKSGQRIMSVYAGYKNSFAVVGSVT